jgi:hypothetical protein
MKYMLGTIAFGAFLFTGFAPTSAEAGVAGCIKGLAKCGDEAKSAAGAIKNARAECQALRDCKKECRNVKKACRKACKGAANKKACKKECRSSKKGCKSSCRDQYKTAECKAARKALVKAVAKEGLACAKKVGGECL